MMICENLTSSADIVNQPHALGDTEMNIQGLLWYNNILL